MKRKLSENLLHILMSTVNFNEIMPISYTKEQMTLLKYAEKEGLTQQTEFPISKCIRFRQFPWLPKQGERTAVPDNGSPKLPRRLLLQLYWRRRQQRTSQQIAILSPTTRTKRCRPTSISPPGNIPFNRRKGALPYLCRKRAFLGVGGNRFFICKNEKILLPNRQEYVII